MVWLGGLRHPDTVTSWTPAKPPLRGCAFQGLAFLAQGAPFPHIGVVSFWALCFAPRIFDSICTRSCSTFRLLVDNQAPHEVAVEQGVPNYAVPAYADIDCQILTGLSVPDTID